MAIHPCEPSLEELMKIKEDLMKSEDTNPPTKMRKLAAIEQQISRHAAEPASK